MKKFLTMTAIIMVILVFISTILSIREKYVEIKISKLNQRIFEDYEKLQSLKAEWSYLNNKEYLSNLISKYIPELNKPIKQSSISSLRARKNIAPEEESRQ